MSGLRFEHVWKLYGRDSAAVIDLDLEINEGEFLVLVGPSGCGKTTSLRMLAGLERPSHGRIWMDGEDVTDVLPGRRDVAMVFQSYALYPNMTVFKNLAFGPRVRKDSREHISRRVEEVAEILGISALLQRHPSQLSGGQRQRVALGRAMIREPKLFLMDEPLSNLDAALRVQMRAELIRLHQRLEQTTTVYVTHDQVEALTMGDRVAVLKDGSLLQIGTPNDLFEFPESVFVGEFIGSPKMNVVPGTIEVTGGQIFVECLGVRCDVSHELAGRLAATVTNGPVLVGIRPHDLHVKGEAPSDGPTFQVIVDISEHTGTEIFATVEIGEVKLIARLPRTPMPQPGQKIDVAFNKERLHLFDVTSKESLLTRDAAREHVSVGSPEPVAEVPSS